MLERNVIRQAVIDDKGGGGAAPAWYGAETNKAFVEGKGFKGVDDVITSYTNLEKLPGLINAGRTVVLPKDDADADGIKAFRAKIGVPDKLDGYKLPDSLKDDPLTPAVREAAFKHGIPSKALESFVTDILTASEAQRKALDAKIKGEDDTALAALRNEWGAKFDENDALAARYLRESGFTDEEMKNLKSALGPARFMKQFHALGAKLGEPPPAGGAQGGGSGGLSQIQAQKEIAELREKRLANKVSDADFNAAIERLGPVAYPG